MIRNPNGRTPRTERDCTFCAWADPIERPAPRQPLIITVYVTLLCVAAVGVLIWKAVV